MTPIKYSVKLIVVPMYFVYENMVYLDWLQSHSGDYESLVQRAEVAGGTAQFTHELASTGSEPTHPISLAYRRTKLAPSGGPSGGDAVMPPAVCGTATPARPTWLLHFDHLSNQGPEIVGFPKAILERAVVGRKR